MHPTPDELHMLRSEAIAVGDRDMLVICDLAMDDPGTSRKARVAQRLALAECARVLSEARAAGDVP